MDKLVLFSCMLSVVLLLFGSSPFSLLESLLLGIGGGKSDFESTSGGVPEPFCFWGITEAFPNALLAIPSNFPMLTFTLVGSRRRGGTGGFPVDAETADPFCVVECCDAGPSPIVEYSSSQTLSTILDRTNRHSSQVVRSRARHHPVVQRGYTVVGAI